MFRWQTICAYCLKADRVPHPMVCREDMGICSSCLDRRVYLPLDGLLVSPDIPANHREAFVSVFGNPPVPVAKFGLVDLALSVLDKKPLGWPPVSEYYSRIGDPGLINLSTRTLRFFSAHPAAKWPPVRYLEVDGVAHIKDGNHRSSLAIALGHSVICGVGRL